MNLFHCKVGISLEDGCTPPFGQHVVRTWTATTGHSMFPAGPRWTEAGSRVKLA